MIENVTNAQYTLALDRFAELLREQGSKEEMWQKLFAECPYILSRSLPLKLSPCQILPLGRPGRREPDIIIQPDPKVFRSPRGLIEIKVPDTRVIDCRDPNSPELCSDARDALGQVHLYAESYPWRSEHLMFGGPVNKFVIMGLSAGWAQLAASDIERLMGGHLFQGVELFGYDELFELYRRGLPQRLVVLAPDFNLLRSGSFPRPEIRRLVLRAKRIINRDVGTRTGMVRSHHTRRVVVEHVRCALRELGRHFTPTEEAYFASETKSTTGLSVSANRAIVDQLVEVARRDVGNCPAWT